MNSYLLIPAALFTVGFLPILLYRKQANLKLKPILFGAGIWLLAVALKSIFAYFFNLPINIFLVKLYIPLYYVYVGLLTGIFEIFIPLFFIWKFKHVFNTVTEKIGFGIGFGSVEAIILGFVALIGFLVVSILPGILPDQVLASLSPAYKGTTSIFLARALWGGLERISATMVHVFCCFMIFKFVFNKRKIYLIIPVFLKTFTDGTSLYFIVNNVPKVIYESFYLVIGLSSLFFMIKIINNSKLKNSIKDDC